MIRRLIWAVLLVFFFLGSCSDDRAKPGQTPNGIWLQQGYGKLIELNDSIIRVFDITAQDCHLSFEEHLLDFAKVKEVTKDTLILKHGIDNWVFTRLEKFPLPCLQEDENPQDARRNFQVFWETFDTHYISFDRKNIDWDSVYQRYASRIDEETSDLELFGMLQGIIDNLDDGHVKLSAPDSIVEAYKSKATSEPRKYTILDEFELNRRIAEIYVDSLRTYNSGIVNYGLIREDVAYLQINFMFMLADYGLSQELNFMDFVEQYWPIAGSRKDELQREDEVAGNRSLLNALFTEWDQVENIIIDLRFNGGGKDGAALEILNHFTDEEQVVFYKKAKTDMGYTNEQEIRVKPARAGFGGKVYMLTSPFTASAAEILVLASLARPNFTRIGSNTEGIFSSTLDKTLPNGWEYELSNEWYEDLRRNNYETLGIPPRFCIGLLQGERRIFRPIRSIYGGRCGSRDRDCLETY